MSALNIFKNSDGSFSFRKGGTALCFLLFAYSVIGFLHTHKFDELPAGYLGILFMVFTFYFGKDVIDNIRIGRSDPKKPIEQK